MVLRNGIVTWMVTTPLLASVFLFHLFTSGYYLRYHYQLTRAGSDLVSALFSFVLKIPEDEITFWYLNPSLRHPTQTCKGTAEVNKPSTFAAVKAPSLSP